MSLACRKIPIISFGLILALSAAFAFNNSSKPTPAPAWIHQLEQAVRSVDQSNDGNLGVYVKKLGAPEEMNYQSERDWYFASTVKVPVAIALLQMVEEGKFSLSQKLTLKRDDPVDGSGEVRFKKIGSKLRVAYLLEKMLTQSDSTATDMLIRLMGETELNRRIRFHMGVEDFHPFTTILQVRKDAFGNLHPRARTLTNRHFIDLKRSRSLKTRYKTLARQLQISPRQLQEKSIEDAFERYYTTGKNSGSLKSFGLLLERLAHGQLLSPSHTQLILQHMLHMTTGEKRIKAGLPHNIRFAQKTGTQIRRICNVGILFPKTQSQASWIVTACLEKFNSYSKAEQTLKNVGQVLAPLVSGQGGPVRIQK